MRRSHSLAVLGALAALVVGCSDVVPPSAPVPARPSLNVSPSQPTSCSGRTEIQSLIVATFRNGAGRIAALATFAAIDQLYCRSGNLQAGRLLANAFIDGVFYLYRVNQLLGQAGANPDPLVATRVAELTVRIQYFVGLNPGILPDAIGTGTDVALGTAEPTQPFQLVVPTARFGVAAQTGFFNKRANVVITRLPADAPAFQSIYQEYPPRYQITVIPADADDPELRTVAGATATVGLCPDLPEPHRDDVRILRIPDPGRGAPVFPALAEPPGYLNGCVGRTAVGDPAAAPRGWLELGIDRVRTVASAAAAFFAPTQAYAVDGGLGSTLFELSGYTAANPLLVRGRVTSGTAGVAGATVTIGTTSVLTGADGSYVIHLPELEEVPYRDSALVTVSAAKSPLQPASVTARIGGPYFGLPDAPDIVLGAVPAVTLVPGAVQSGGILLAGPNAGGRGAAWHPTPIKLDNGFSTTFSFLIDGKNSYVDSVNADGGGDGFAFVIQNSAAGSQAIGLGGTGLGYQGITNSVAIEFDTWDSDAPTAAAGPGYDPNNNHVAVQSLGANPNTPFDAARLGAAVIPAVNMSDGAVHTVTVTYAPPSPSPAVGSTGALTVVLDGVTLLTRSITLAPGGVLNTGGSAYLGFTAGTGFARENHRILSWTLPAPPVIF